MLKKIFTRPISRNKTTSFWSWFHMSNRGLLRTDASTGDVFKGVLKYFANFTGKHPCWSLFFILKRLEHRLFFLLNLRNFEERLFWRTSTNSASSTHVSSVPHFYTLWKRQKTKGFRGYRNVTLDQNGLRALSNICHRVFVKTVKSL